MQGFSKDEFRQRLDKAQFLMREQGMDLMLLTSEPEVRYFSGFFTQFWLSPTRPWFLLIPDRGYPVAVIPEIGEVVMRKTWVRDIRTWSSPQPADEGISLLSDTINEMVGGKAVIGLSKGHESVIRMPLNDLESLRTQLPGMRWMNCTPLIRELRMEKSPAEVAKIRHICQIASDTFDQAASLFEIGQPLDSVFRAFKIAMLQQGADDVPYLVGGAGQGGYGDVISPPSQVPIEAGDILMLDTGSTYEGYYCDFDRNFAFGHASDIAKRAYQTLYQATEAGLAIAKPGATCAQVYQAMQSVIEQAGGGAGGVGRMGHGLGMQLTEWPSNMASDHTVITPNMVLTLEPSMGLGDGKMMVHEENILITEYGPEMLSRRAAPELPII
ncbi:M24 family metallopeptidase [Leucothrix mucor]|uniref:M24 family metallopeptidase n=1 Tax=Leucothrix mucor TaxID=45248 RepID=UPI0003B3D924|nr:Xaa-Pro peptidase family protein [Leucothrix mucor]